MDWQQELLLAFRIIVSVLLGGFVGWEREQHGRQAGIRTFGAVALGSCVFALISSHVTGGNNPHVIAAGVVTGIGFLGAGTILREQGGVVGLTSAASLWAVGSLGMAVGYGMYTMAALVSLILFGLLKAHDLPGWEHLKRPHAHASYSERRGDELPEENDVGTAPDDVRIGSGRHDDIQAGARARVSERRGGL